MAAQAVQHGCARLLAWPMSLAAKGWLVVVAHWPGGSPPKAPEPVKRGGANTVARML